MSTAIPTRSGNDPYGSMFESISALTERIKDALESDFAEVAVRGEITNLARPKSGHLYLSLRDNTASIRAVIWKSDAQRLPLDLSEGLAVRVLGRLTVYAPRGEYQLVIRHLSPTAWALWSWLSGSSMLGLRPKVFSTRPEHSLPRFPRRIVIVTSPTGAAVRDLLQVTGRRWSGTDILIAPTRVQGAGAEALIAGAIGLANRVPDADVIIVARGGGAAKDLWAFNEEIVVRAIVGSKMPVVSAVGHEIDVTLADLAADRRA